ncbi:hypothetical protein [uncultured Victivallis sp.]|uniref:hypothetical protein n=1 Tax=uncultured Victivallis sp. TaxID=354118 RepID=UPI0025E43A4C|nr:hypothetical protein [uncultured Victivallis sp.]
MGLFKFRCVFCRQKIAAEEEWIGMFAECPSCHRRIDIRRDDEFLDDVPEQPEPEVSAPPEPEAPPPFPEPFQINLPKWELPKAEKP